MELKSLFQEQINQGKGYKVFCQLLVMPLIFVQKFTFILDPTGYNTSQEFKNYPGEKLQYMFHKIEVGEIHIDSALTIEFTYRVSRLS